MTEPYVKQYNENGTLTNPITKSNPYLTFGNRKTRRTKATEDKGGKMFVVGINRAITLTQIVEAGKKIVHYISVKVRHGNDSDKTRIKGKKRRLYSN